MKLKNKYHFPLLLLGMMALLFGIWSGLGRMGWQFPQPHSKLLSLHGPLMIGGFLGTLISLERAVAVKKLWGYLAPLFTGIGAMLFILFTNPGIAAPFLMTLGSLFLVFIFIYLTRQHPALSMTIMAAAALMWFIGNLLWLTGLSVPQTALWWAGFLILTITGERLELSRFIKLTKNVYVLFIFSNGLLILGIAIALFRYELGTHITGLGMLFLTFWLLTYDLARRNLKKQELTRFIGVALISGYIWLGLGGILAFVYGGLTAGPFYDAILHTIFVGFVFSMIFGHAPVIFPSVLGLRITYHPVFYLPLLVLHLSLVLRIGGDLLLSHPARQWGGLFNGVAIVAFLGIVMFNMLKNK